MKMVTEETLQYILSINKDLVNNTDLTVIFGVNNFFL